VTWWIECVVIFLVVKFCHYCLSHYCQFMFQSDLSDPFLKLELRNRNIEKNETDSDFRVHILHGWPFKNKSAEKNFCFRASRP
jgi:hypothetical protein